MKCAKCKGKKYYMAMGWQKKTCKECNGVGSIVPPEIMEQARKAAEAPKKKRGRPKKEA